MYGRPIRKAYQESVRFHPEAARAMKERGTGYHPLRQSFAFARGADFLSKSKKKLGDAELEEVRDLLERSVARLGEAAAEAGIPDATLQEIGEALTITWMKLNPDRQVGFDK